MKTRACRNSSGFTLVELMIALAMAGIIVAAVYSMYTIQQKTYTAQDQVTVMQQNIRAAIFSLVSEIRMAGYDPKSSTGAHSGASFTAASVSGMSFLADLNENFAPYPNLDPNETVTYGFLAADDGNGDGIVDNADGFASFGRITGGGVLQAVAENIQAIEFLYTMDDDSQTTSPADVSRIRSVTISILARAGQYDPKYSNKELYTPASGNMWDLNGPTAGTGQPANDNFRRRFLTTTVKCRNMGI